MADCMSRSRPRIRIGTLGCKVCDEVLRHTEIARRALGTQPTGEIVYTPHGVLRSK